MRLKQVFISEYKNLKNFSLNFDDDNFVEILVGKNGCGKSNLLEVLVEIFHHAKSLGQPDQQELLFDYKVIYEIKGTDITLEWRKQKFYINNDTEEKRTLGRTPIPLHLLVYYSGHNETIGNIVNKYEARFAKNIKAGDVSDVRELIRIGTEYKSLLLSVLLMQPDTCKAKLYLKTTLEIENIGLRKVVQDDNGKANYGYTAPILKLTLKRPNYAIGKADYDIVNQDSEYRFWKATGKTREFLDSLFASLAEPNGLNVANGYQSDDTYIFHIDIEKLRAKLPDYTLLEFFHSFDMLSALGMIEDITVPVALTNNRIASIRDFSDGQFQSVYIYAITELFKNVECLTLLDEPDAFLHPEWQYEFFNQINAISADAANTNHIIMSSHSAVTLIPNTSEKINFIDLKSKPTSNIKLPKRIAIQKLSNSLIQYREQESLLSIINTIQIENKPILFTEGSTDPIILKEAWYKLYNEDIPFIPFYAFSCSYINQLITDTRIHAEMRGLPIFALFDFDKAYNQWNGLNGNVIESDPSKGLCKKWASGESYAFMLPIPEDATIHAQVYRNKQTKETFLDNSNCAIEHLFYAYVDQQQFFRSEASPGGQQIYFCGDKTQFAKNTVPSIAAEAFEVFKPLFEFIRTKCTEKERAA